MSCRSVSPSGLADEELPTAAAWAAATESTESKPDITVLGTTVDRAGRHGIALSTDTHRCRITRNGTS